MFLKYSILLAVFLGYGLCESEKNISRPLNGTVIGNQTLPHADGPYLKNMTRQLSGAVIGNQTLTRADGPYLVTSDLVVTENATLTIEAGTLINFVPSVGIRVRGSFNAKGTPSQRISFRAIPCGETSFCNKTDGAKFYSRGIRLVNGTSYDNGRLELQYNGQWGAFCYRWNMWGLMQVACRHLGFLGAKKIYYHPGSGPVMMTSVNCKGTEKSLWDCPYHWITNVPYSCHDGRYVGIECDALLPYLAETFYWKGIHFEPTNSSEEQGISSLEYVDIDSALEGVNVVRNAPELLSVTINGSASGLNVKELAKPLTVVDSSIMRSVLAGVSIEIVSSGGNVVFENVIIQKTRIGGGLVYKRLAVNFCSVIPQKVSFPLLVNAAGNHHSVNCSKVFRASSRRKISLYLRLIEGSGFELNITDASTANKTHLYRITNEYNGKAITTIACSILEISFYSKGSPRVPANLEMIVMEDQGETLSLVISNSTFSDNFESGITVENLIGNSRISQTKVIGNNYYGLYANNTQGKISVLTSVFLRNKYSGFTLNKMTGTLEFSNVNSTNNRNSGIAIDAGTLLFQMSESLVKENRDHGLQILNQVNSTINISSSQFIRNGEGIHLQEFRFCYVRLVEVSSLKNGQNGAWLARLSDTRLYASSCKFDGNWRQGVYADYFFGGGINLEKISTSQNYRDGFSFQHGETNINIESSSSFANGRDGFFLYQGGKVVLKDFAVHGNKLHGLQFHDRSSACLQSIHLLKSNVSGNSLRGVVFYLAHRSNQGLENFTVIKVANSTILNNARGGCVFYHYCSYRLRNSRQRRIQLLFIGNEVKGNQEFGLIINGPEWFELNALLANNRFCENSGLALEVRSGQSCYYYSSSPFNVEVSSNNLSNNKGEYVFFVDCNTLPLKCRVMINNNTILDNQRIQRFSYFYLRTKTQAVLAVKGGNVTIKYNSFTNPSFSHELAALLKDHEHVLQAEENWWGTRDECEIKDRVFDFEDRVELAQIQYYPYLDSSNSSSAKFHDGVRPFCFLRGNRLGGTLNQTLNITNQIDAYQVISDVTILSDGVLYIEENVTLGFSLKSVFLVQGQVIIKGKEKERVKFLPKVPSHQNIRLVGGPAPWEGIFEIWINSTWIPVCTRTLRYAHYIICRQLGYEPERSYYHDPRGKDKIFLHDFLCNIYQGDNINVCNKNSWFFSSSCTTSVLYVSCKIPYWTGIHLAASSKESFVSNVEVHYAGFPYRDDLNIPGIAFRVDLPRHVISGVFVSNSAFIGFQIMYPDPVKSSYKIENLAIAETESDGIRLESPFLELYSTHVVNTKGYGFSSYPNWNALNSHVLNMADATVKKFMDVCTESERFMNDSSVVYYLVVTASSVACKATMTVPREYTIGLQLIYNNWPSRKTFRIYNGADKTAGTVWNVHTLRWSSRPTWISGNRTILLETGSWYWSLSTAHFLMFLIKKGEEGKVRSPSLVISRNNFSHNTNGGIFLGGEDTGIVDILNTNVRDSPQNGLSTGFSHVNSLKLLNCQFVRNKIGIKLSSFSGNVTIENTKVFNSTENGLYVNTNGEKTIHIEKGGIFHSNGYGLYLYGRYTEVKLSATRTFFGWNKESSVYSRIYYGYSSPCPSHTIFTNCTFYANRGPVVDINRSPHSNPWKFDGNFFLNNSQGPVILTTQYRYNTPGLFLRNNSFLFNLCQDKSVIDIKGGTKVLVIEGNIFKQNYGRSIFLEKTSTSGATIRSNVFTDNKCLNSGVVEIQRMDEDILIVGNTFELNKGLSMVFLHCEYIVGGNMPSDMKNVTFSNNSLINNVNVSSSSPSCVVKVTGFTDLRTFFVNYNRFSSEYFSKEFCVSTDASSYRSTMQASLNFWGYDDEEKIKERIFDAEDNYQQKFVVFCPFISSAGIIIMGSRKNITIDPLTNSVLGGRISSNVLLKKEHSPYTAVSDITILPEASLSIDPDVEVQFMPGVSMLVLGSLFVGGKENETVRFSLSKKPINNNSLNLRLAGGKFPWEGHVQILYNGNWTLLRLNETEHNKTNDVKLICEHLGYQAPLFINYSLHEFLGAWDTCASIQCNGNETYLAECSLSFQNLSCNTLSHLVLNCGGGRPWGNIRFIREARNTSSQSKSSLKYLRIEHCGEKHDQKVAAIEMIQYVPEVSRVTVLNCTSGGIKAWFPEREVIIMNSSFVNTGGDGVDLIITKNNVTLENVKSVQNEYGLSFHEAYGEWINIITYGQINLCSPHKVVDVRDRDLFIYFKAPSITFSNLEVSCSVKVQTEGDASFTVQLLVMKSTKSIRINAPDGHGILVTYYSSPGPLSKRRMIAGNSFTVSFQGWYSSEMLLQVQRVDNKDMPCPFDYGFCKWRRHPKSSFGSKTLTQDWYHGRKSGVTDHTYSMSTGGVLWIQAGRWGVGYGALTSPSIFRDSNYCFLVFYYRLHERYRASASVSVYFVEDNADNGTLLWSTSELMNQWKMKEIELPSADANYSIVILGYVKYYGKVYVDDLGFVGCDSPAVVHQVTGSVFSGNVKQGVRYTSTQSGGSMFRLERCQVTNNGLNPVLNGRPSGVINFTAVNQEFDIVNNYIAGNNNGGIYSRIINEVSTIRPLTSHIHANTIENNRGSILRVEGVSEPYADVKVTNNYFSRNLARDWDGRANIVCIITNFTAIVQGNFFYDNVGHYVVFYDNPQSNTTGLRFVNNTLYKNVNYGATILCNGAAEILGNVLQNPNNRYQISTTTRGSPVTINATFNWWGESVPNLISALIMDKTKDYRLSLKVVFQPFTQKPPLTVISASCPPEWIKDDEMCFMYKGGSFTFLDAKKYCGSYGGNIINTLSNEDKQLLKHLRQKETLVRSDVLPSLWTISRHILKEPQSGYDQNNNVCPVVAADGNVTQVNCDGLHPFVCVRRPVIHCPNSCFHNGDCIGATCFCYPGWTGEDCSKFDCHNLHNCSGNGECMGPNVCKCYPGYLGRGCTYSFCGKYASCADCVTDPFCGWCDSSRSCLGGFAAGPPRISCPAWFYYHCYTVGDGRCSHDIVRVNCRDKHCNLKDGRATIESCQKCRDLEKCHKIAEENRCRTWNETQCPGGEIKVDYSDPQRRYNVKFVKNVKIVEPNETLVYACPVILPKQERVSLILVVPEVLNVQKGDILCSPQAGGVMHKIVKEISDGPFQLMLSAPAGLEEVIKYADFRGEVTAEQIDDDSTFEDEPDQDDLWDVISGNITFDEGRVTVLSNEIYKCLGHTYDTGKIIVHSYFLVIEKNNNIPKTGDIVVSNVSHGFIETVVAVHRTNNTHYLETKFQRCKANSYWEGRSLIILSYMILKVVEVYSSGNFLLVEVISANLDENGTIITAVDINMLKSHHRRRRRSTRYDFELASFKPNKIHHKLLSTGIAELKVSLGMSFTMKMFLEIEKSWLGFEIEDATAGLELDGSLDFSLTFTVGGKLRYNKGLNVMREKQLGRSIYIPVGPIRIPAGLFLGITGRASIGLSGKISRSLSVNGVVSLGGECRWSRGSCYQTANTVSLGMDRSSPGPQLKAGASIEIIVTPRISVKMPAFSQTKSKAIKISLSSLFDDLAQAAFEYVDLSLALFVSVPLKAGLSVRLPTSQCTGKKPAELENFYEISGVNLGVSIGFLEKHLTLELPLGYSQRKRYWDCICPVQSEQACAGPSSPHPSPPEYKNPTPLPPSQNKGESEGENTDGNTKGNTGGNTKGNTKGNTGGYTLLSSRKIRGLPCGRGPICAGSRTGPSCTQPDLGLRTGCSGNGRPVITSRCGARCRCSGGWGGNFCNQLNANGGGDPHLETLDGE
ncbi:uncharacterized protein LOC111339184 [Stylophora pistillata]|uniref:uncharacterized protein LOC111339184 n=1 Tax=Stylophora pistillata TaxID=50429 RepID=UPI000C041908|nr:uncharacterized protein LOC111339184 [Stylophora pistillata]